MVILIVCGVLAATALVLMVAWRTQALPATDAGAPARTANRTAGNPAGGATGGPSGAGTALDPRPAQRAVRPGRRIEHALRGYLWWACVVTVAGLTTAILWTAPAGRLIMRLLALTSPEATGRLTEAGEQVGVISPEGTLSLLIFGALPGSFLSAVAYALIHRWLPPGPAGGLLFGVLLLVVVAPVAEPLRPTNVDFAILQPGWLAVLLFALLVLGHGMLLAAVTGWYGARLHRQPQRPWLAFAPLLAAVLYLPAGFLLLAGGVLTALGAAVLPEAGRWWVSRPVSWTGRIALAALAALSLPGFIAAVASIAGG